MSLITKIRPQCSVVSFRPAVTKKNNQIKKGLDVVCLLVFFILTFCVLISQVNVKFRILHLKSVNTNGTEERRRKPTSLVSPRNSFIVKVLRKLPVAPGEETRGHGEDGRT